MRLSIIQLFYPIDLFSLFDSILSAFEKKISIRIYVRIAMGLSGSFLNRTKLAPPSRFLCNFHPASTDVRADNRAPIVRLEGILTRCSPERTSSKEMRLYPSRRSSNKSPTCLLACNNDFTHQSTGKSLPCSSVCPTIRQLDENKKQAIESIETDRGRGGEGSGERNN